MLQKIIKCPSYWEDEYSSVNIVQYNIGIGSDIYKQILVHLQTGPQERFIFCLISLSKNLKSEKLGVTSTFHALCLRNLISCPTVPLLKPMLLKLWHHLTPVETSYMNAEGYNILIYLDNKVKICPMRNVGQILRSFIVSMRTNKIIF